MKKVRVLGLVFVIVSVISLFGTVYASDGMDSLDERTIYSYDENTGRLSGVYESLGNVETWVDGRLFGAYRLSINVEKGIHRVEVFVNGKSVYKEIVFAGVEPLLGDMNLDGKVDIADRSYLTHVLAAGNNQEIPLLIVGDMNLDGAVNRMDRVVLARFLLQ